jgi:hypothetical protein
MEWRFMLRKLFHRLFASLRRGKTEREMDAEMRFHLEMETAENIRRGMSEEEARQVALRSFGGMEQVKEAYRDPAGFDGLKTSGRMRGTGRECCERSPASRLWRRSRSAWASGRTRRSSAS